MIQILQTGFINTIYLRCLCYLVRQSPQSCKMCGINTSANVLQNLSSEIPNAAFIFPQLYVCVTTDFYIVWPTLVKAVSYYSNQYYVDTVFPVMQSCEKNFCVSHLWSCTIFVHRLNLKVSFFIIRRFCNIHSNHTGRWLPTCTNGFYYEDYAKA